MQVFNKYWTTLFPCKFLPRRIENIIINHNSFYYLFKILMYEIIYKLLMKAAWYSSYVDVLQIVKKKLRNADRVKMNIFINRNQKSTTLISNSKIDKLISQAMFITLIIRNLFFIRAINVLFTLIIFFISFEVLIVP